MAPIRALDYARPETTTSCITGMNGETSHAWAGDDGHEWGDASGSNKLRQQFVYDFFLGRTTERDVTGAELGYYVSFIFPARVRMHHVYGGYGAREVTPVTAATKAGGSHEVVIRLCADATCPGRVSLSALRQGDERLELQGTRFDPLAPGESDSDLMSIDSFCETPSQYKARTTPPPPSPSPRPPSPPRPSASPAPLDAASARTSAAAGSAGRPEKRFDDYLDEDAVEPAYTPEDLTSYGDDPSALTLSAKMAPGHRPSSAGIAAAARARAGPATTRTAGGAAPSPDEELAAVEELDQLVDEFVSAAAKNAAAQPAKRGSDAVGVPRQTLAGLAIGGVFVLLMMYVAYDIFRRQKEDQEGEDEAATSPEVDTDGEMPAGSPGGQKPKRSRRASRRSKDPAPREYGALDQDGNESEVGSSAMD